MKVFTIYMKVIDKKRNKFKEEINEWKLYIDLQFSDFYMKNDILIRGIVV